MSELGSVLRELARGAEPLPPADPAALWSRGRARIWRHRVGAVGAVVLVALLVGSATFVTVPGTTVVPASNPHDPSVPMNVWAAKSWFPSTTDDGPPGVVAVLGGVGRNGGNGLFSVSAVTGAYRLLDLPGRADVLSDFGEETALAPDGRHIAYWFAGKSSGKAYPDEGVHDVPVGVAVYDTVDGSVERYRPETEHGLSSDGLVWLDSRTLMLTYGQRTSGSSANRISTFAWRPGTDEPRAITADEPLIMSKPEPNLDGSLLVKAGTTGVHFGALTADGKAKTAGSVRLPDPVVAGNPEASYTGVARSDAYVVAAVYLGEGSEEFRVGRIRANGSVDRLTTVTGLGYVDFVGWLAENRVLVLGTPHGGDVYGSLHAIDLDTLQHTRLGTAAGAAYSPGLGFATDLLRNPMVAGNRPPTVDPRWWIAGVGAGLVLVAGIALSWVWRRHRAQG